MARGRSGLGVHKKAADEEDVVVSAFDAFLRGVANGQFARLDDRDDLCQILVMLTERKAVGVRRDEQPERRCEGHVQGESAFREGGVYNPDGKKGVYDEWSPIVPCSNAQLAAAVGCPCGTGPGGVPSRSSTFDSREDRLEARSLSLTEPEVRD